MSVGDRLNDGFQEPGVFDMAGRGGIICKDSQI